MQTETIAIPGTGPGTTHALSVLRFGTAGARPRVYVQGGLHADEGPGMIAARALADRLAALDSEGRVSGEVVVVPAANPLGLGQRLLGTPIGRFDLRDGQNFNRGYPDLAPAAAAALDGRLGADEAANVAAIRAALAVAHAALAPVTPAERLKHALLGLALGSDWVLDLHCDSEAAMHLYTLPGLARDFAPLCARLGCAAVLVAEVSGLNPFDEAVSRPWADLAAAFPDAAIPLACRAATVELRGEAEVDDGLAAQDADAIVAHLTAIGAVTGRAAPPPPARCAPTPLAGAEPLTAPVPGLVLFRAAVGQVVEPGQVVAEILDPATGRRTAVRAGISGVLFARTAGRIAAAGGRLGKIAGHGPMRSGALLSP